MMLAPESFFRLGWQLLRTVIKRALRSDSELPRFMAQYRPDGMLSAEPDDPQVLAGASRCFACGRCDALAWEQGMTDVLGPVGPMAFVLGASRQAGTDLSLAATASDDALRAFTDACPVRVPFVALASLVRRRHAEYVGGHLDAPRPLLSLPPR
jgi:hypothetical protein